MGGGGHCGSFPFGGGPLGVRLVDRVDDGSEVDFSLLDIFVKGVLDSFDNFEVESFEVAGLDSTSFLDMSLETNVF